MNLYYAKTILYAYPNIEVLAEQIDEVVERKAISSMMDFRPCLEQCYSLLDLTYYKDCLFSLKLIVEDIISILKAKDLELVEYKYFHSKKREDLIYVDINTRSYYRRQAKIVDKIALMLENRGINNAYFEEKYLCSDFFKELLERIMAHEKSYEKARKFKPKTLKTTLTLPNKLSA